MNDNATKTILITGSTDGIGLATARMLAANHHNVLLHGRSRDKLNLAQQSITKVKGRGRVEGFVADLSDLNQVKSLADHIIEKHKKLDALINNAGVFSTPNPITADGMDVRYVVNTLAPFLLTKLLLPIIKPSGRVVNLSSAAQSPVNLKALRGEVKITEDFNAYAQSKLAITMWSRTMAKSLENSGPSIIAVNPGSMLGSKMVKEGFGVEGGDINIGADILVRAALSDEFEDLSGIYYDNDSKRVSDPHPDALDPDKSNEVVRQIQKILADKQHLLD